MNSLQRSAGSIVLIALFIATTGARGMAQDESLELGQDLWRSCSSCHGVPDRRVPQDRDWLELNKTTTCISGEDDTPEMRRALIAYLDADTTLRPLFVDENHRVADADRSGMIRVPPTAGSAYLKADRDSVRAGSPTRVRLSWQASKTGKSLVVPAGSYRVINYAFYRVDAGKKRWSVSGSSAEGCADLVFGPGKEVAFELLPELQSHLDAVGDEKGEEYKLGFTMSNKGGQRMSIACDGRLVDPTWIIRDEDGEIIDRGKFEVT